MREARIFLLTEHGADLVPMDEMPYEQEIVIQELLEKHPDLLPGEQITPGDPRRWLLVTGEMPVPDVLGGGGRWSLDHLLLDQNGTPTFVECKRAVDTRGRREVVAQMLDYAANGIEYWSMDRLRQVATQTAIRRGRTLEEEVLRVLGPESDLDEAGYWQRVESNLRDGKVRLIFVAEETSKELRRLVEFLNDKLRDIEVLAVEIKQFLGDGGRKVLVPRVVGLTEAARVRKADEQGRGLPLGQDDFLGRCTPDAATIFTEFIAEAERRGHLIEPRTQVLAIRARRSDGRPCTFSYLKPPDVFQVYEEYLLRFAPEAVAALRDRILPLGVFVPSGSYTLNARVTAETASRVRDAFAMTLDDIDSVLVRERS